MGKKTILNNHIFKSSKKHSKKKNLKAHYESVISRDRDDVNHI